MSSVEKSAFEFVEAVRFSESVEELEKLFLKHAEPMGVDMVICAQILGSGGVLSRRTLFGAFQHDWFAFYRRHNLFFHDVIVRRATETNLPILWSDIRRENLTATETVVMEEPSNFRLADGLAIPIHGAGGEVACMSLAGQYFVHDFTIEAALHLMTIAAHRKVVELLGDVANQEVRKSLSPRQRECLHWLQYGKSNEDIATILGISANTVKDHIDAARKAFGVSTRIEAVIQARRANLIGL